MGRHAIAGLVVVAGCSFSHGTVPSGGDDDGATTDAAVTAVDARPDAQRVWTLIDTLMIVTYAPQLTPTPTRSNVLLVTGQAYRLRASGAFICTTTGTLADAEYWDFNTPNDLAGSVDFGISIDNQTVGNTKAPLHWGGFAGSHVYETDFVGKGAKITAVLFDSQYNNNDGTLKLEIFELR